MMKKLTVVARVEADEEQIALVKSELLKLVEPTRLEQGCIEYYLHQDNENPALFIVFENWETSELFEDHLTSKHISAFLETTKGAIINLTMNEMSEIG